MNPVETYDDQYSVTLVLMVGLPRSGKSTRAKELLRMCAGVNPCVINPDSFRIALHGQSYVPEAEETVWAMARVAARAAAMSRHKLVIIDATNTSKKRRDAWIAGPWSRRAYIYVDTDKQTCLKRCGNNMALCGAINRMERNFEPVEDDECLVPWSDIAHEYESHPHRLVEFECPLCHEDLQAMILGSMHSDAEIEQTEQEILRANENRHPDSMAQLKEGLQFTLADPDYVLLGSDLKEPPEWQAARVIYPTKVPASPEEWEALRAKIDKIKSDPKFLTLPSETETAPQE